MFRHPETDFSKDEEILVDQSKDDETYVDNLR